jgi:hypothetical protein
MFKDCKSGGYNLEQCQAKDRRLLSLILLIAIAYTCTINKGQTFAFKGIKEYICRLKENLRKDKSRLHDPSKVNGANTLPSLSAALKDSLKG